MWAAVLGSPIAHSLSPILHRAAYAHLGLSDWSYEALECRAPELPAVIDRARAATDFGGYSLTMPLKVAVLSLLDELEPVAERVAAVNTVVSRGGGLHGANTDVAGIVDALREAGVPAPRRPVVLGGGGSALAAIAALAQLGAAGVRVVLRDPAKAGDLRTVGARCDVELSVASFEPAAIRAADLIISTAPANASDALLGLVAGWPAECALFDLVYAPWPTPLAERALAAGAQVVGGLDLLVHQAVGQVALMTGHKVEVAVLRGALART